MRITNKGQVTIPIEIRRQAKLVPGTEVEVTIEGDNVVFRKAGRASTSRGQRMIATVSGRADAVWTTEEIMALTRGEPE